MLFTVDIDETVVKRKQADQSVEVSPASIAQSVSRIFRRNTRAGEQEMGL